MKLKINTLTVLKVGLALLILIWAYLAIEPILYVLTGFGFVWGYQ